MEAAPVHVCHRYVEQRFQSGSLFGNMRTAVDAAQVFGSWVGHAAQQMFVLRAQLFDSRAVGACFGPRQEEAKGQQ